MLHDNCKSFKLDTNGKVIGVELKIIEVPNAIFTVNFCKLIDEYDAGNRTIAYNTFVNPEDMIGYNVGLCYPYENRPEFKNVLLPGNNKWEHVIVNGYNPPERGYLNLCVIDSNKKVVSDILTGVGLPYNRHICFRVQWKLKNNTEGNNEDNTGEVTHKEILVSLIALKDGILAISSILIEVNKKLDRLINYQEGD